MIEKLFSGRIVDVVSEDTALALCISFLAPAFEDLEHKETSAAQVRAYAASTRTIDILSTRPSFVEEPKSLARIKEHLEFLKRVSSDNSPISETTAEQAKRAWWTIWAATNFAISIPAASTGPDGKLFYEWDRGVHHFEIEFIPNQPAEFFYRNRKTGELWDEEYVVGTELSPETIAKLKLIS